MWSDPIADEVRRHRHEHAKQFDYDLKAICRDLRKQQAQAESAGKKVVNLEARRREAEESSPPAA